MPLKPEAYKEIEKEALAITANLKNNNDYQIGYIQGLEAGYEQGATQYATIAAEMAEALKEIMSLTAAYRQGAMSGIYKVLDEIDNKAFAEYKSWTAIGEEKKEVPGE